MFMNEYSHTIDAKGRMILPAKFREELGSRFALDRECHGYIDEKIAESGETDYGIYGQCSRKDSV